MSSLLKSCENSCYSDYAFNDTIRSQYCAHMHNCNLIGSLLSMLKRAVMRNGLWAHNEPMVIHFTNIFWVVWWVSNVLADLSLSALAVGQRSLLHAWLITVKWIAYARCLSSTRVGVNSIISTQLQLQLQRFQLQLQLRPISRISTPTPTPEVSTPTPTPANLQNINSNSNSGGFNSNSNSNSGKSPEYQLQLQLQLRSFKSTPTPFQIQSILFN